MWNFPKLRKIGISTMLQNVARTIVQHFLKITQNWDFDNVAKCCAKKLSKTMRNFSKLRKIGISTMELLRPVIQVQMSESEIPIFDTEKSSQVEN